MNRQDYYPSAISQQVHWLGNFAQTLSHLRDRFPLSAQSVDDAIADARWLAYTLGPYRTESRRFAPSATQCIEDAQTGTGEEPLMLTAFHLPPLPPGVVPRAPGALRRLFKFIVILKRSAGYDPSHGSQLGILPRRSRADHPVPTCKLRVGSGDQNQHVFMRYFPRGRPGVFIQCRIGEGDWDQGVTGTGTTYVDKRPLAVPGQPEVRHYRLCYWDGGPVGEWTDVITLTVGP